MILFCFIFDVIVFPFLYIISYPFLTSFHFLFLTLLYFLFCRYCLPFLDVIPTICSYDRTSAFAPFAPTAVIAAVVEFCGLWRRMFPHRTIIEKGIGVCFMAPQMHLSRL